MIFKPKNATLWDTFILPYDQKFYLFYLQNTHRFWDGYGLAVSDDLLHWHDYGCILSDDKGMATGSVYRVGEKWILSYCRSGNNNVGCISFACSDDLFNWKKLPEELDLYPDPTWYDESNPGVTSSRFGDLWVEQLPNGEYVGFLTASINGGPVGANGVVGYASSCDGLHWQAQQPVSKPCGMGWAELGAHVAFADRHYLLVGSNSGLGMRFDSVNNTTGKAGGMYVMMSENIDGPYELVNGDPLLLGCRNAPPNWAYIPTYYTRTFHDDGQILVNHHWMPRDNFTDAWLGTCKVLKEETPGKLALYWWPGNAKIKGDRIFDILATPAFQMLKNYQLYTGQLSLSEAELTLETASSTLVFSETKDLSDGIVIETVFSIVGQGSAGFCFGTGDVYSEKEFSGVACLVNQKGFVEFGSARNGVCSPIFMPENQNVWPVCEGQSMMMRMLIRGEFIEVYIQNKLVQCYGFMKPVVKNVGIYAENCRIKIDSYEVYQMT